MKVSERTAGVEYAIRDIITHARAYEKKNGKNVIYLNIGDPVQYDFPTPDHIKDALIKAVQSNENFYTASEGLPELRQAIVEKEKGKGFDVTENDVLVTNGVSEALDMTLASVVSPGDEILMPGPHYPPYASYAKFYGGKHVEFKNPRLILKLVQFVLLINTETFQKQNSLLFQYSFNLIIISWSIFS